MVEITKEELKDVAIESFRNGAIVGLILGVFCGILICGAFI